MSRKILDIEVLRGVAVLFVVVHHANINLFAWTSSELARFYTYFGGAIGVDLFFAISGFVIARELLPKLNQCQDVNEGFRVALSFWIRRAWRLLPSAWLWLLIILTLTFIFNDSGSFGGVRSNIEATFAGLLQVANFRLAETFGRSEYGASAVYWSLSMEEQFYIVLPLVALILRKHVAYLVGFVALIQMIEPRTGMNMYEVCFRTDALCLGVLLAIYTAQPTYELTRPAFLADRRASLVISSLLLLILLSLGSGVLNIAPYRLTLVAILSAGLVFIASYDGNYFFYRLNFLRSPLIWFGSRSYAIYLTHMPCFFIVREIWYRYSSGAIPGAEQFMLFSLSAGGLILLLSEINYRLIELPLRKRGAGIAKAFLQCTAVKKELIFDRG
ncbi:acyltransferase family protein [Aquipseudomonas alcaligenes]|jgi:peptidoglycan/LPS O-acetylase OafA/YrhL|uniref:Acyltransferase n=1 Tax=Aquipseudomonas alcaligenes TaxID=43263 RepID=A0AA37CKH5_AQUAC|nr:acyltransferase [Pseudomonas alcaligenes]BCR22670.1 acyltransferase [Pseudomonas alcaligenes]GIZ67951.1 acyltransferase [Pseudomonas alcaligenes]GIZ72466.1 acyltransferase [Pseudomonas alcaligenes]GIZ76817.1 acyltransferase [Pseudomonas alcaligenes]GIZ80949.1 acyltransferase [Pseudomonas alcaligenes]